jgi:hypothetical protein
MGKIYSLPKEIGEPPRFITSDNYDSFLKAEQEYEVFLPFVQRLVCLQEAWPILIHA